MSDNTSKRRRGSVPPPDHVGSQTRDPREPSRRESQSQGRPSNQFIPTGGQAFDHPIPASYVATESSRIGQRNQEGKMMLMPLPKRIAASSRIAERNRTTHACDLCRKAKAKCTGGQPCQKCKNEGNECIYGDGKRDKERKELERTARHNESLRAHTEALRYTLRDVVERTNLSESEQNKISELLSKSPSTFSEDDDDYYSQQSQSYHMLQHQGEMDATGEVGSTGSLDAVDVDTNRNTESRAIGFLGKSSSARWIQRAEKEVCDSDDGKNDEKTGTNIPPVYQTRDPDLCGPTDRGEDDSWQYEMPSPETATNLVDCYFTHVHPDFPILFKDDFMQKFHYYLENHANRSSETDRIALCQINCVFAISCTVSHLIASDNEGDHRDHLVYYYRARTLGLEQQTKNAQASLDYICALGLLGLYLVSNYFINRAWNLVGLAVRNAVTLGLHVRSEATQLSDLRKELQIRVWWSLFSLEVLLNEITGRPSCISYRDISAPHPLNYSEEELFNFDRKSRSGETLHSIRQRGSSDGKGKGKASELQEPRELFGLATPGNAPSVFATFTTTTYFKHRTALNVLTNEVLGRLFCAVVVNFKWNEVQDVIREIDARLQKWKSNLPEQLRFTLDGNEEDNSHLYQRKGLSVMYHTARMILHRPALCRMEGRIKNESAISQKFNRDAVAKCVESARALLATIGKPTDPIKLFLIQPCWEIIPHLCQAASILMLEIAFCACHIKNEAHEILQDAKDSVRWLRAVSRRSIYARQAWQVHDRALRLVARNIGADISDMATEEEVPPGWDQETSGDYAPPARQETLPDFIRAHDRPSINQSQNLAATSAWVESNLFQSAGASQLDMNQMYASNEYSNQGYFPGRFDLNSMNHYTIFDSPGFPWDGEHTTSFMDPPREMQWEPAEGMGTAYQSYGSGEMGMASRLQEATARSSQLRDHIGGQGTQQHGYQDVEDQYPAEGSYGEQWQQGGGGG